MLHFKAGVSNIGLAGRIRPTGPMFDTPAQRVFYTSRAVFFSSYVVDLTPFHPSVKPLNPPWPVEVKGQLSIELSSSSGGGGGFVHRSARCYVFVVVSWLGGRGRSPESSSLWTELCDWPNTRRDCESRQGFFFFALPSNDPGAAQILGHNLFFVRLGSLVFLFFPLGAKPGKPVASRSAARPIRVQQPPNPHPRS